MNGFKEHNLAIVRMLVLLALAAAIVVTAWLCDDAFITLRTVKNFLNGDGLRWNIVDRVQTFTHPLWLFFLSAGHFVTKEPYYSTLAISFFCALLAFYIVISNIRADVKSILLAGIILLGSRSVIEYSTGGLENPLSFLLVALYFASYLQQDFSKKSFIKIGLIASLVLSNRLDLAVLLLPSIIYLIWQSPRESLKGLLIGGTPLALWLGFSTFYYGTPFPNTAYAKLGLDVERDVLLYAGAHYLEESIYFDIVGSLAILTGSLLGLLGEARKKSIALGVIAYLGYLLWIGGDFMAGRFIGALVIVSVILICSAKKIPHATAIVGVLILTATWTLPVYYSGRDFGLNQYHHLKSRFTDERAYFYQSTGFLLAISRNDPVASDLKDKGLSLSPGAVVIHDTLGLTGYWANRSAVLTDQIALSDPLLSRLYTQGPFYRPGHVKRNLPCGYRESLITGRNYLCDPALRSLHDKITLATKAELLAPGRLGAIIDLNFKSKRTPPSRIDGNVSYVLPVASAGTAIRASDSGHLQAFPSSAANLSVAGRGDGLIDLVLTTRGEHFRGVGVLPVDPWHAVTVVGEQLARVDDQWTARITLASATTGGLCYFYPYEFLAAPVGVLPGSDPRCSELIETRVDRMSRIFHQEFARRWR